LIVDVYFWTRRWVQIGERKVHTTKVIKKSLNPVWTNETKDVPIENQGSSSVTRYPRIYLNLIWLDSMECSNRRGEIRLHGRGFGWL
jgi:hypothetical protein